MSPSRRPRPSIFHDAMRVTPGLIASMRESDLNELMSDLLQAQAHRCGSPLAQLRINTEDKAKDDGSDGWTAKPASTDEWLGDTDTCWQFKAGGAGEPARLKGEVKKRIPSQTLSANGRLVVVASGSTNGLSGEEGRLKTLVTEAEGLGLPSARIVVIGSERLAMWCNQHPAVAARWAGRPHGLWTLEDWASSEQHQVPWQASDPVKARLGELRDDLDFASGAVQHLHIRGQPGVGKTRFALELCRDAPWKTSVVYIQQAKDVRLIELIDSAAAELSVRLVVVADEVQFEDLRPLRESVGRASGRIRLITIGHCATPDSVQIPIIAVEPLEREMARAVVKGWYPGMPPEHVDFVVQFAEGYVRLLKLTADVVARDPAIDVRGLLHRDEIRNLLDRMLGDGDRRALHVVAVLRSVGWRDESQAEGEAVAAHLGLDWNDVRAKVDAYQQRLGIAPLGGSYRYISPRPLGNYLGPSSAHWDQLATSAREVAKHTKLPKLRAWANDAARELGRMAEHDREREAEEDLRNR